MLELTEDQTKKLQALVDAGVAPDISAALDLCLENALAYAENDDLNAEDLAKIQEGIDSLDRGEGIVVQDLDAFFEDIVTRGKARAAAKRAEAMA